MIKVKATAAYGSSFDVRKSFKSQFQVDYVRGCEIEGILNSEGRVIEEMGI